MRNLRCGVSRLTIVAVVSSLGTPLPALAASFDVPAGTADNVAKTVSNDDIGTIAATGSLTAATAITWSGGSASPGVAIINSGTVTGNTRALDSSGGLGTGSITVHNNAGALITATGNDGWRINNTITTGTVTLNNAGTFVSAGGQALDWAAVTSSTANIRIINNATGTIRSTSSDAIRPGSGNIQITNSGLIESTPGNQRGINLEHPGSIANVTSFLVTNNAGASILSGDDAIRITAATTAAASGTFVIDNAGLIRSSSGQAIDFDNLSQATSITIINRATGVIQSNGNDALRPGNGATITNFGQIISNATVGTPFGVDNRPAGNDAIAFNARSGAVTNTTGGLISGFRHGISVDAGNSVTVVNEAGASIIGRNGSGFGSDGNGTVVNYGLISGDNTNGGTTMNVDGDGVDIDGIGSVTNYGTIRGTGASGVDSGGRTNGSEGVALGGGTIINAAGALISGANAGILVDDGANGSAFGATTITNAGTIQGLNGFGIRFVGNFNDTITNTGTISGTNGLAIDMGAGNDTLNLGTGSNIIGQIDGGAGSDTINLSGTGLLTNTVNFETLNMQSGSWTLSGANTFSSGLNVLGGSLTIASGASITSSVVNSASLTNNGTVTGTATNNSGATLTNASTWNGNVTNNGGAILSNAGTWNGNVTSAGAFVNNGTVNGAFASNGGTLSGNGRLNGNVTLNGGTLSPGNSVGTLTINGSLVLTSATTYLVEVSSAGADRVNVTGSATLGGAGVTLNAASGSLFGRYTILNAAGGVSGTFGPVASSQNVSTALNYDANNVFLDIRAVLGTGSGLNQNQQAVATTINSFANGGGLLPTGFGNLFSLTGTTLANALTQLSGEVATGTQQTTFDAMDKFVNVMTDPFMGTRAGGSPQMGATSYADEDPSLAYAAKRKRNGAERDAYAAFKAPPRAVPFEQRWSVWGAGYGGTAQTDGDAAVGSQKLTNHIYGGAAGFDYRLDPNTLVGFALGGAGTNFGLANGLGGGRSEMFQAGLHGRHTSGPAYVSGAVAWGWQDITTNRTALGNSYRANFDANAITGRLEGGWRFAYGTSGLTPYAAGQVTSFFLPGYAEQLTAGVNTFALNYADKDVTASRTELGLRGDTSFTAADAVVTLRGRAAWAHNFNTDRSISAIFQTLPASGFTVFGVSPTPNSALVSAGAEAKWLNGFSVAATFEGEFSGRTESYAGKGTLRYQW
jgi:uncharacterized protein with beta-barrel porin domain